MIVRDDWSALKKLIYLRGSGAAGGGGWSTVTGNPVTFSAIAAPLKQLQIAFSPVQDLHGYDSPWPAGGGKNKFDVSKIESHTDTYGGIISQSNGTISLTTSTGSSNVRCGKTLGQLAPLLTVGETYIITGDSTATSAKQIYLPAVSTLWKFGDPLTITQEALNSEVAFYASGTNASATITQVMIRLSSVSATSYSPYSNECPISGWDGVEIYLQSAYDPTAQPSISISFGSTVYSGTLDVLTGVVTVTMAEVDLGTLRWFYWKTVNPPVFAAQITGKTHGSYNFMCSNYAVRTSGGYGQLEDAQIVGANSNEYVYVRDDRFTDTMSFTAAVSGAQIVYELATPITIQLTPQEVSSLLGENNMWSNANQPITVEYRKN